MSVKIAGLMTMKIDSWADVEIEISRRSDGNPIVLSFVTEPTGPVRLGAHVRDAVVLLPRARVEIGQGAEVVLVAPVDIQCGDLAILANKVIVENPPESSESAVYLQSDRYSGSQMSTVPITRNGARLFVSWPGAEAYPWHDFEAEISAPSDGDPSVDEALRRFRMFVVTCRGYGRNQGLTRSRRKIDSGRMTKGSGQKVLALMLNEGIVSRDQSRYYLFSDRLAELTQTNYADCMAYRFTSEAIAFVRRALENP